MCPVLLLHPSSQGFQPQCQDPPQPKDLVAAMATGLGQWSTRNVRVSLTLRVLCSQDWAGISEPPARPKAPPLQGKGKDIFSSFPSSFQKEMWDGLGPCVAGLGGNPMEQETSDIIEETHGITKIEKDL